MQQPLGDPLATPETLAHRAAQTFKQQFGRPPRWLVAAPGRVNVIGEHTDYNGGFVLPMAIQRYAVIAAEQAARPADGDVRLYSTAFGAHAQFDLMPTVQPGQPQWTNYVRGVLAGFARRDMHTGGFDAVLDTNVPVGGGLSSSAALEVATATLVEAMTQRPIDRLEKALLCQKAEHLFAGTPCGIMDQFTSIMGQTDRLLLLDCRSLQARLIPLDDPRVMVLIVNSNVRHELAQGDGGLSPYAQRRWQCQQAATALGVPELRDATMEQLHQAPALDLLIRRRARHVISEIARTLDAAKAIAERQWSQAGALMYASHASLRDDFQVSIPELDLLVQLAQSIGESGGVYGSRMTGGGFGGCTVSLVHSDAVDEIAARVSRDYEKKTHVAASLFVSRPASGARVLPLT